MKENRSVGLGEFSVDCFGSYAYIYPIACCTWWAQDRVSFREMGCQCAYWVPYLWCCFWEFVVAYPRYCLIYWTWRVHNIVQKYVFENSCDNRSKNGFSWQYGWFRMRPIFPLLETQKPFTIRWYGLMLHYGSQLTLLGLKTLALLWKIHKS